MQRPDEVAQEIKNNPPQQAPLSTANLSIHNGVTTTNAPLNDNAMSDDEDDIPNDIRSEAQSSAPLNI